MNQNQTPAGRPRPACQEVAPRSQELTVSVPTLVGVEGRTADELRRLGLDQVRAENGRVFCQGAALDLARLNLNLRTGERVLLVLLAGVAAVSGYVLLVHNPITAREEALRVQLAEAGALSDQLALRVA